MTLQPCFTTAVGCANPRDIGVAAGLKRRELQPVCLYTALNERATKPDWITSAHICFANWPPVNQAAARNATEPRQKKSEALAREQSVNS